MNDTIIRKVSFVPSEFYPVKTGDKPGSLYYMNSWVPERIILEQLLLEVTRDTYKVIPSYAYFVCDSEFNPVFYIGSNMYRSVFNSNDIKNNTIIDLNIPVKFSEPIQ